MDLQEIGKAKKKIMVGDMLNVQYVLIYLYDNLEKIKINHSDEVLMFPW